VTETKTYNARLATRLTSSVDTRLRQLALLRRWRISHLLDEVLDQALSAHNWVSCARLPGLGPAAKS
jgi:hypothetical protein